MAQRTKRAEAEWKAMKGRETLCSHGRNAFGRMLAEKDPLMRRRAKRVTPKKKADFAKSPAQRERRELFDPI